MPSAQTNLPGWQTTTTSCSRPSKLLTAIIEELRVRRHDIAEELIAPCVCALEAELAPAKEHVWEVRQQLRALQEEHKRPATHTT
jgi:hypothetical protein